MAIFEYGVLLEFYNVGDEFAPTVSRQINKNDGSSYSR